MNAVDVIEAHRYLYYVRAEPIWSDLDYDAFCAAFGIPGGGGSDRECDYSTAIVDLADQMNADRYRYSLPHAILMCRRTLDDIPPTTGVSN